MAARPLVCFFFGLFILIGCGGPTTQLPPADPATRVEAESYIIGPLDRLDVFVWRNPDISTTAIVRPDGRVTLPLVEDLDAAGRTPSALAREIEDRLSRFILDPFVTVRVSDFVGPFDRQIRIVGEAAQPQAIPFRDNMTVLDVMIAVGGLTEFAAGNRTTLVRRVDGEQREFRLRLDDLLREGDISANVAVRPGDVIIVPETFF